MLQMDDDIELSDITKKQIARLLLLGADIALRLMVDTEDIAIRIDRFSGDKLVLPEGVRYLDYVQGDIKTVVVPEFYELRHRCFSGANIERVDFLGHVDVPEYCFEDTTSLVECNFHKGVGIISTSAFYGCTNLKAVRGTESCTDVQERAFAGCASLKEFKFGESLSLLWAFAFSHTGLLEADMRACSKLDVIPRGCFEFCSSMESVALPSRLYAIQETAFRRCTNLSDIEVPDSVATLSRAVFGDCFNLRKIKVGATRICSGAFLGSGVLEVTLTDGVKELDEYVFDATSVTHVRLPRSLRKVAWSAFASSCINTVEVKDKSILFKVNLSGIEVKEY